MAYNKGVHGGNHRTRPYGFMLMLAFAATLLGALMLHKLRERRVYNLLVKEKVSELLALQLLLQKERDRTKEIEGKNEEMKAKIYALRGQKMELDKRVLKMKSTMNSLKEEQRLMESAFEDKQNEIRMLQGHANNLGNEVAKEVKALTENLKQKDDKHITNEDGSNSELSKFKGGEVNAEAKDGIKDRSGSDDGLIETYEHGHASRKMGKHRRMNGMNMEAREQKVDKIRELEKQNHSFVQQNWSGRLIKKDNKNAGQEKSNVFHEQPEELQEKQVTDGGSVHEDGDDFFKESLSDFGLEKEEYREEIDDES